MVDSSIILRIVISLLVGMSLVCGRLFFAIDDGFFDADALTNLTVLAHGWNYRTNPHKPLLSKCVITQKSLI